MAGFSSGPDARVADRLEELLDVERGLVIAIDGLRDAVVSQQRSTNNMTAMLVWLTVVIVGVTVGQLVFFWLGGRF